MTFLAKSNAKINNRHIPSICTNLRSFYPEKKFLSRNFCHNWD